MGATGSNGVPISAGSVVSGSVAIIGAVKSAVIVSNSASAVVLRVAAAGSKTGLYTGMGSVFIV